MTVSPLRTPLAWALGALVVAAIAVPVALGCVIPRDLEKQLQLAGDDIVVGTIEKLEEVWATDSAGDEALWTLVDFRIEEAWRSGKTKGLVRFYFRGGVTPGAERATITPSSDDMQVGQRLLVFLAEREFGQRTFGEGIYQLDSYAECYRVATIQSRRGNRELVQGKGEGFAFENNVTLGDARAQVRRLLEKR
ncbi:MAG: hypothetical protein RL885_08965 [Planctomycetota bacterium]